jgi:hypothetical protein
MPRFSSNKNASNYLQYRPTIGHFNCETFNKWTRKQLASGYRPLAALLSNEDTKRNVGIMQSTHSTLNIGLPKVSFFKKSPSSKNYIRSLRSFIHHFGP